MSYVAGIVVLGVAGLVLGAMHGGGGDLRSLFLWASAFLIGEVLWLHTPTRKGNVSMASTIHLAVIPLAPLSVVVFAAWAARLFCNLLVQRQPWYKAMFNASQVCLAVFAASWVYGQAALIPGMPLGDGLFGRLFPGLALAFVAYYTVNTGSVSGIIALVARTTWFSAWRENFGYRVEFVSSIALFLLAPVATITYQSVGGAGIILFLLPMLFIRDAGERFIELEAAQRALISSERLAAKGEMAASVGHELNNYLSVLSGNLQMLQRRGDRADKEEVARRLEAISQQAQRMATLSHGLMDFYQLESRPAPTALCELVQETLSFLRPQNRLDGVQLVSEYDPRIGVVTLDAAQIQQVVMNLVLNAADAMRESNAPTQRVFVAARWNASEQAVELVVEDTGPGIPDSIRAHLFEPGFTTKATGHGFGLSTVFRIVSNHRGRIHVERAEPHGARFRVLIPCRREPEVLAA